MEEELQLGMSNMDKLYEMLSDAETATSKLFAAIQQEINSRDEELIEQTLEIERAFSKKKIEAFLFHAELRKMLDETIYQGASDERD